MWDTLREILHEIIFAGGWTQIYASFCCLSASWFALKKLQKRNIEKVNLQDYFLFLLWLFGFFWWFLNFMALSVFPASLPAAAFLLKSATFFLILHLYFFLPVLFLYLIPNKKINLLFDIIFGIGWFSSMFYILSSSYVLHNPATKEFYLTSQSLPRPGFFIGSLDFIFLTIAAFTIFYNIKREVFSLYDLSPLYLFFSVVIYGAASLLNVLFIYTRHLTYITFTLVPILTYLGYKKYLQ